jgi:hypothetical protein
MVSDRSHFRHSVSRALVPLRRIVRRGVEEKFKFYWGSVFTEPVNCRIARCPGSNQFGARHTAHGLCNSITASCPTCRGRELIQLDSKQRQAPSARRLLDKTQMTWAFNQETWEPDSVHEAEGLMKIQFVRPACAPMPVTGCDSSVQHTESHGGGLGININAHPLRSGL